MNNKTYIENLLKEGKDLDTILAEFAEAANDIKNQEKKNKERLAAADRLAAHFNKFIKDYCNYEGMEFTGKDFCDMVDEILPFVKGFKSFSCDSVKDADKIISSFLKTFGF